MIIKADSTKPLCEPYGLNAAHLLVCPFSLTFRETEQSLLFKLMNMSSTELSVVAEGQSKDDQISPSMLPDTAHT